MIKQIPIFSIAATAYLKAPCQKQVQDVNGYLSNQVYKNIAAHNIRYSSDYHSVDVNFTANDKSWTSTNSLLQGGAFMGNTDNGETVEANQEINPKFLSATDDYYNKPGASTVHEFIVSYEGAKISQELGTSSPRGGLTGSVYKDAHDAATKNAPQSGSVNVTWYDKYGGQVYWMESLVRKIEWSVQDGNKSPLTVQTVTFP